MTSRTIIEVPTSGYHDLQDLTPRITAAIRDAGIQTGIASLFVQGSTGALGLMEVERGLARDLPEMLNRWAPPSQGYAHEQTWHDGNGHSHLQATLLGQSVTIPVAEGAPDLGTWQQVFLLECDIRPRKRTVVVTVIGD